MRRDFGGAGFPKSFPSRGVCCMFHPFNFPAVLLFQQHEDCDDEILATDNIIHGPEG